MSQISQLSATDIIVAGDLFPVYKGSQGDARKAAASVLLAYMQENLDFSPADMFTTQYASPSATGFTVNIDGTDDSVHLILTPTGGFAAGTIKLPAKAGLADKQELLVNCTQAVTTLTIDANGAGAVTGAPTTLAANDFFRLKYDASGDAWYRVG